jgi:hypothetical protein
VAVLKRAPDTSAFVRCWSANRAASFAGGSGDDADDVVTQPTALCRGGRGTCAGVTLEGNDRAAASSALRIIDRLWAEFDVADVDQFVAKSCG